ncbi:ABC transporter ATP-binding protein [Nocardioides sp.]|uniref:ABC transporter ATP-binding protein n=1 Tax=Nocardioides sp. TaxID=35761 RepID=UPI0039E6C05F
MSEPATTSSGLLTVLAGARAHPRPALAAAGFGILNGASMVVGSMAMAYATDTLVVPAVAGTEVSGWDWASSALAVAAVSGARWASIVLRGIMTGQVQYRAEADTRRAVVHRYLALGLAWHRRHPPGRLVAHAVSDVEAMWSPMQWTYFAIGNIAMLLLAMVDLFGRDVTLGLVGAALVVTVLALNLLYQQLLRPRTRAVQAARAEVAAIAHESVDGGEVVRALGLAEEESARFGEPVERLRLANGAMSAVSSLFDPILELLPTVAVLAVLATAPARVAAGQLSVGDVVGVVYLMLTIAIPLNVISRFLSLLPLSVAGRGQIDAVLGSRDVPPTGAASLPGDGPLAVELDEVVLDLGANRVLDGVSLSLAPGTVTALVGEVGAGKTSLLEVAGGLLTPAAGRVLLDGVEVRELRPGALPAAVGLVPQTPYLFATSIRDNLVLDTGEYDDGQLWRALRVAVAEEFVRALPHGLDTVVGERGATLSGGQRQRLCLARALLRRPRLLLLDDPTSALDARVEHELLGNLAALTSRRDLTVLMVANRQGAIALADRVALLAGGRVIAQGTHAQLRDRVDYRRIVAAYEGEDVDERVG